MAKRKRLSPVALQAEPPAADPGAPRRVPIADMAGDAATQAALAEMSEALERARAEGRLIQPVPLEAVEAGYLLRDRLPPEAGAGQGDEDGAGDGAADPETEALIASLRQRGQQVPIEVCDLGPDHPGPRYGLISGWRRLMALRRLWAETGEARFATVLALLRAPESAAEAYQAMIEENELRVGLSYYERARVAVRAAEAGVFADSNAAIDALFANASKAKRSKIRSFVRVHGALESWLRFPAAIPERLGLRLAKALEAEGGRARITDALSMAAPASAEAELAALTRGAVASEAAPATRPGAAAPARDAAPPEVIPGVRLRRGRTGLTLSGPGVDAGLEADLAAWLRERLRGGAR